jgi:hypothetical protein
LDKLERKKSETIGAHWSAALSKQRRTPVLTVFGSQPPPLCRTPSFIAENYPKLVLSYPNLENLLELIVYE